MATLPYAKARASIDGGAAQIDYVTAATGQTCQLTIENPSGVQSYRWEIVDYPPDFDLPSGWFSESDGTYYSIDPTPTVFTLTEWGKYMIRLRINSRLATDPIRWLDESLMIEVPHASGIPDVSWVESQQKSVRGSVQDLKIALRKLAGSGSQIASTALASARTTVAVSTGSTGTRRGYAASARTLKSTSLTFRYVRLMLATAPAVNETATVKVFQYNTGGFVNTASNWTELDTVNKTLTSSDPVGILEFDLGAALTIPANTLYAIYVSSLSASNTGSPATFFAEAPNGSTAAFVGAGWIWGPGNTNEYSGGVLGSSATATTNVIWWEVTT